MTKNKECKAKQYTTNEIVLHSPLVCFGGFGRQPACKYLKDCLEDYKEVIGTRRYNNIIKKICHTKI